MKYHYVKDGQPAGPVEENELIGLGVTRETLVWCKGMAEWTKAGNVAALAYLFANNVPNVPYGNQERPKTYLAPAILATIFCCWPFGVPAIVYAALVERRYSNGDYQGAKKASRTALMWTRISFWVGLIIVLLVIAFYALLFAGLFASTGGLFSPF